MSSANMPSLLAAVQQFGNSQQTALVIGDLMLDRYCIGSVQRISPEAPVPVVLQQRQQANAGGAANVAHNLKQLGIACQLCGCIGMDAEGDQLLAILQQADIGTAFIHRSAQRPTISKTRIMSANQQIVRVDVEQTDAFSSEQTQALDGLLQQALDQSPAVVILSDYAKGLLSPAWCQRIIQMCQQRHIPVLVDPKGHDYSKYHGATALTPNKKEAAEACAVALDDNAAILAGAAALRQQLALEFIAVTRGDEGISLITADASHHISATAQQVFDVSGAGDTVIATLAAGLMHGLAPLPALQLANIAAGIVVGKVGTVPIAAHTLMATLSQHSAGQQSDKIVSLEQLQAQVTRWRQQGQRIVFTNGCFDLLHAGHVSYLEAARQCGDKLILALNTDRSVQALKGPSRPIHSQQDRATVLAGLAAVDAVVLFDHDTPLALIQALQPDILVKGSDYQAHEVVGAKEVIAWGGEVKLIPLLEGRSTSATLQKLSS